jgi:hypothetical protein
VKKHPTDEALLLYCDRQGEEEAIRAVRAHLEEPCERCTRRLEAYREVLSCLETQELVRAPEERIREALQQIGIRAARTQAAPGIARRALDASAERLREAVRAVQEVRLRLAFDSRFGPALQGIRAHSALAPRQLLFEADQGTLHLQVLEETGGRVGLIGQFLPSGRGAAGRKVRVVMRQADAEKSRSLDASGSFEFHEVDATVMSLEVVSGGTTLATGQIELRQGRDA